MPQSIDDFLNSPKKQSDKTKKNNVKSINEFLNPSYPMKELVTQGKLPSANPEKSPFIQQYAGQGQAISAPIQEKLPLTQANASIGNELSGVPKALDYIFKENPVAKVLNYPFAKATQQSIPDAPMIGRREDGRFGNLPGLTAKEQFAQENPISSTGSKVADKALGFTGEIGSYMFNPAGGVGQGAIGVYKSVAPTAEQAANKIFSWFPSLGKAASKTPQLVQRMGREAAREGATALAYSPMRSLVEGEGDLGEMAKRAGIEGAMGAGIGGALPLVGKGISRIIEKYRPKQVQPTQPMLALPEGRLDQRLKAAEKRGINEPGLDPIANEHQFGLPEASDLSQNKANVTKEAIEDLSSIDNELKLLESKYQQAINDQYEYLKESLKKRGGVNQGNVIKNPITGEVTNRYGRTSKNPQWYRDYYAENGKVPSRKELYQLAKKQVDEGYRDDLYEIPSWSKENSYIETVDALTQVRNTIRQTLKTMDSSDALLKDEVLSFEKKAPKNDIRSNDPITAESKPEPITIDKKNNLDSIQSEIDKRETEFRRLWEELKAEKDPDKQTVINARANEIRREAEILLEQRNRLTDELNSTVDEMPAQERVSSEREFSLYRDSLLQRKPEAKNILELDLSDEEFNNLLKLREKAVQEMKSKNISEDVKAMNIGQTSDVEPIKRTQQNKETVKSKEAVFTNDNLPELPRRTEKNANRISRNEVIQTLKSGLGVVIDTGRLGTRSKGVRGIFKTRSEVIRSRSMHDISTIAHEVGHALEKRHKLLSPQFKNELMDILKNHSEVNASAYDPSELLEEGFAEYVRLLLTEPKLALESAPKFSQHFMDLLPNKEMAGIKSTQEAVGRWLSQDGLQSAMGKIDKSFGKSKRKFNYNDSYTRLVNDLNPMKLVMNAVQGKKAHITITAEENLLKTAQSSRGMGERAKLAIERGIYNDKGEKISEGLGNIIKDLEKIGVTDEELSTYLSVIHAQDLKAMGKQIPFTDREIANTLTQLDSKAMRGVQKRIIKYNDALMELLVEGQVYSKETVDHMKKLYPNYVPFMRFFDDDLVDGFTHGGYGSSKGFANLTDPIKRMSEEGSERTLIDTLESMVRNTYLMMNNAEKNKVGLRLYELSKLDGAGKFVEHLPDGGGANSREHIITVKVNGQREALKIRQPDLYEAMLSLDTESSNSLIKFLGYATNVLRGGATLTPEFMVRNVFRDVGHAVITAGFNPLNFARGMYFALTPQLKKMGFKIKNNRLDEYISSGGAMSTMMGMTRDYTRETMQEAFKKSFKQRTMNVITNPKELAKFMSGYTPVKGVLKGTLKTLRAGSEISEFSTKLGIFDQRLRKGDSLKEATYKARDSMDFNRAGSSVRQANKVVAFLNAQIQGVDKLARSFKEDPAGTMIRGFTSLTLPTIGLHVWYSQMGDEQKKEFENIPQWQKDMFFIIPGPNNTFARIPKPFEAGLIFSTFADRVIRDAIDDDPEAWNEFAGYAMETFSPPVMIQALNPFVEAYSNHSFFRNAPIVPRGLEGLQRKDQHDIYTSETAKLIAKGLDKTAARKTPFASPKIIDNTITGLTAGLGRYAVSGIDKGIKAATGDEGIPKPAKRTEQNPFLSPFMAQTKGSGQIRNRFYDKWDELSREKNSAVLNKEKFDEREYAKFNSSKSKMDELNQKYKKIMNHSTMTPKEKRDKMDILDRQMNDIAYQVFRR